MQTIGYRRDIDGLRALAVTLVVLVHAFPAQMRNGFIGVDVFFVISGFLITGIVLTQLGREAFSLRAFYVRRANRIFPALIVVLAACAGFGWLSLYASEFALLGRSIASGAGFAANIDYYLEAGYWDIAAKLKPLLHLWSLGVEEQFYLAWPLLLWAAFARRLNIAAVCLVLFAASLAWNLYCTGADPAAAFYLPFSRMWELLAGGLLAYAAQRGWSASPAWRNAGALLGLALIVGALFDTYPPAEFPGWHAIPPVLGAVLIIAAGPATWFNRLLGLKPIVSLGLISYPLYLWHWPLLAFARIIGNGEPSYPVRAGALLLAVALAAATFHLVEKPIRASAQSPGAKAIALACLLALTGAAGLFIYAEDGLEARYAAPRTAADPPLPPITSTYKVALLGDSSAGTLGIGLVPIYKERLVPFTAVGWPYLDGVTYRPGLTPDRSWPGSPQATEDAIARIRADREIEVVIISHMYLLYFDHDLYRSLAPAAGETGAQAYEAGLRRTVRRLTEAGKTVVYVRSIPALVDVPSIAACTAGVLPIPRAPASGCVTPIAAAAQHQRLSDDTVERALRGLPNVTVFDTHPFLCDAAACYVERDGILLYRDGTHVSDFASKRIGTGVARLIESRR